MAVNILDPAGWSAELKKLVDLLKNGFYFTWRQRP